MERVNVSWKQMEVTVRNVEIDNGSDGIVTAEMYVAVGSNKLIHVIDEDGVTSHFVDRDGHTLSFEDLYEIGGRVRKGEEVSIFCDVKVWQNEDGIYRVGITDGESVISDMFNLTEEELENALVSC